MNEVPWLGLAFFGLVALVIFLIRADERRERELTERQLETLRQASQKKESRDLEKDWQEAYLLSKSTKQYPQWRAWMEERGYGPESIIERAELRNQDSKRKP